MRNLVAKTFLLASMLGSMAAAYADDPTVVGGGFSFPTIPGGASDPKSPAIPDQTSGGNPAKDPNSTGGGVTLTTPSTPTLGSCLLTQVIRVQIHLNGEKVWIDLPVPGGGCLH